MIRLKPLLTILLIGAGIFVGLKVGSAYYTYYRFQSDLEEVTMTESYSTRPEGDIQESVAARGRDYGIPLRLDQIRVRRLGNELSISTQYSVHFDIPIYPFDLTFAPMAKNKRL